MLSFSNFGSVRHPEAEKVAQAVQLLRQRDPSLVVDGEMQADTALDEEHSAAAYPFSALKEQANVLIFPNLSAGNIAYKLLNHLGGATAIGPILVGMNRPVHVLEQGADVQDIVNMAAVAVMDAQRADIDERARDSVPTRRAFHLLRNSTMATADAARSALIAARKQRRTRRPGHSRPPGEVHWNLSRPSSIAAAARRGEGELADMGPFVAVTTPHTGRSPNDKFVVQESRVRERRRLGQGQPAASPRRTSTRCSPTCSEYLNERDELFVQDLYCGADPAYRLSRALRLAERVAHGVRAQHVHPPGARASSPTFDPNFTVLHAPELQADPATARHAHRHVHRAQPRRAHDPHRRHALRRRAEEVDVHGHELPAAEAGRALDALLGEHRQGRRHGALLRTVRHRQDDAVGRSRARSHRRRRARLGGGRRLQLRGRLLREGDQPLARGRAGHLPHDADVRHDPRERRARPDHEAGEVRGPVDHREHARVVPAALHPELTCRAGAAGIRRTSSSSPPTRSACCRRSRGSRREQAMYYFLSGYTAKVAGTERGVTEPQATFSACFGAVFLVWHPTKYAEMLGELLERARVARCGW